jgi:uncharacterized protein (TIGR02391 family)
MDYEKLRSTYGRLMGLLESLPDAKSTFGCYPLIVKDDYNMIVDDISKITEENLDSYKIPESQIVKYEGHKPLVSPTSITRIKQFISYLQYKYQLNDKILELGSLINAIENQELRDRCLDLLSARGKFDRVLNQATLVLEGIIRKKSGVTGTEGTKLINEVFKVKPSDSILIIEGEPEEHEGFGHICRGLMLGFRNLTHHKLMDKFSREDALKFCGFIDILLKFVDSAKINKKGR